MDVSRIIVPVDRLRPVERPEWAEHMPHQDLERLGPTYYPLSAVSAWLHPRQEGEGTLPTDELYRYLVETGEIRSCLGTFDSEALQRLGVDVFRRHFPECPMLYFWLAIAKHREGSTWVRCLHLRGGGASAPTWRWSWAQVDPPLSLNRTNPAARLHTL